MRNSKYTLNKREFINYKFFNSLFLGLSIGTVFTIYSVLEPFVFSFGGVILAFSLLFVAKIYTKILNIRYFFYISMLVEVVMLIAIIYFLLKPYHYQTALFVYIGYQIIFTFGSYLLRAETIFLKKSQILSFVDVAKQKGYLLGMLISFVFYKVIEYFGINSSEYQVFYIHFLLFMVQLLIIYLLFLSFKEKNVWRRYKPKQI